MVNYINLIIEMSPRFILGRENVPCVAEVVHRSLKADCTDYTISFERPVNYLCDAWHVFRPSAKRGLILIGLELNTNAGESFEHY